MAMSLIFYEWAFELMHWHQGCIELGNENQCEHNPRDVEAAKAFISDFRATLEKYHPNIN